MRLVIVSLSVLALCPPLAAQTISPGRQAFASRCAGCHGTDGNGGELGPAITTRVPARTDEEIAAVIRQGSPPPACPPFRISPTPRCGI